MIPRIAHFHWTGGPMSWLRWASLMTFKKYNPRWEIRLHDTPPDIKAHDLRYCDGADWTWWRKLAADGGFMIGTDVISIRPVPEEWLDCDLAACLDGNDRITQVGMMGASKGNPFMEACERSCEEHEDKSKDMPHQIFGVWCLQRVADSLYGGIERVYEHGMSLFDIPTKAISPISPKETSRFWHKGYKPDFTDWPPEDVVGVHWFGGDASSTQNERYAVPGSGYRIVAIAQRALNEGI